MLIGMLGAGTLDVGLLKVREPGVGEAWPGLAMAVILRSGVA